MPEHYDAWRFPLPEEAELIRALDLPEGGARDKTEIPRASPAYDSLDGPGLEPFFKHTKWAIASDEKNVTRLGTTKPSGAVWPLALPLSVSLLPG